ncbi:MAG: ATP-dependent DNA helicase [Saprospiraceae bacterium]|nr:ATP-dependent DNA helicase [Saprospiraceae bacterium]
MTELQQRNDAFRAFLDTLNPAQRAAVAQTEGPVLVIAGPGTGKTQLLSARIGNILLETDARPQNILCLTFTDAGATAMRRRLLQLIGPTAHQVPVFTFHAFSNRVIQENAEYFSKGNPEPLSELERIEMVRKLLAQLPADHPLRQGKKDVFQYEAHLRDLFDTMKREGWTPGHVLKQCSAFLQNLPENPAYLYQRNSKLYKKGDPKTAQIAEVTEKILRLQAAADLFPRYQVALERAARYEFEDMLRWVLQAFEKNEALLRTYQERYQYILVDEFQDTNGAQFQLLNLLLDFWQTPNIFIVGDDDQSIYEFQGARLQNLRYFKERYQNGLHTILLTENYRSTQTILDAAGRLIAHNNLRAVRLLGDKTEKILHARHSGAGSPEVRLYPNRLQEMAGIVAEIEILINAGTAPQEIAVLYARHRQAERLLVLLEKKGIPYQTKRPVNSLDLPLVRQIRTLWAYLRDELQSPFSGEHHLFRLLHAPFWQLDPLDLAKLALACRADAPEAADEIYIKVGALNTDKKRWRDLLSDPKTLLSLHLSNPTELLQLGRLLNEWIAAAENLPLTQLLERLFAQTGLLDWTLAQPDKWWHLQVLSTLLEFVRNETARNPRLDLGRLLDMLDGMDDNKLALPLSQPLQPAFGVQLLTAHAAKGLEFEAVFVLDATEDAWDKNNGGQNRRFFMPDTLTRSGEEDALEARRRLFYVAMTRAKNLLSLSYAKNDDAGKILQPSRFLSEAALQQKEVSVDPGVLLEAQTLLLLDPAKPVIRLPEPALLDALLADFTLSITAMNRYLRCPLAFYYEDILKSPGAASEAAAFGLAMHGALQQFVLKMKGHKQLEWPSTTVLTKLFAQEMERQRGFFTENGFTQRLALGQDYLRRIHVEQVPFWRKRVIVERRIDRVELDGVPLTGILDKIEWMEGGTLRIVDYKTGTPDPKKTAPPSESQPYGGDYWRQLAFYTLLLERSRLYPEPVGKTAISWLEPDKRGTFPVTELQFSESERRMVEQWIQMVYNAIQHRAFHTGCGETDCRWCQMHRDRDAILLSRDHEIGLDD